MLSGIEEGGIFIKIKSKWGFGMAPISDKMQIRYDNAVQTVADFMCDNLHMREIDLGTISELKGMFNRCVRQDQWDWFSVYTGFGEPNSKNVFKIVSLLTELRKAVKDDDAENVQRIKAQLIESNLLHYLHTYQSALAEDVCEPTAGWIYILSTREQPDILKIGMTRRTVAQRVKEINSATGVLIPYAARRVFRVHDAFQAEKDIFKILSHKRIRADREFFKLSFSEAVSLIENYLSESKMRRRCYGNLIWFDHEKYYGFISLQGHDDVFVHFSQIPKDLISEIKPGTLLEFDLGRRPQGPYALNVSLVEV